jgi:hypothetical protein
VIEENAHKEGQMSYLKLSDYIKLLETLLTLVYLALKFAGGNIPHLDTIIHCIELAESLLNLAHIGLKMCSK